MNKNNKKQPPEICVNKIFGLLIEGKENKSSWKENKKEKEKCQKEHKINR